MTTAATPEPGIYEDVPFAEYLAWDAVSNSRLSLLAKSPRHFQIGEYKEATLPMQLGQLIHCGVLEPLAFAARYAILPEFHLDAENTTTTGTATTSKTTKYVKDKIRDYTALCTDREVVPREWYEDTLALVKELHANTAARELLQDHGPRELSILWHEGGITCKARIDKKTANAIVDLKTTAMIENFQTAIGRFQYHRQLAHYQNGWHVLTGETLQPWLIAVETSSPFAVLAAPLSSEALVEGHIARNRLLDKLRACRELNEWPGMPNPRAWQVPAWAIETEPVELIVNGQTVEV